MKILLRYISAALLVTILLGVFVSCKEEEPTPTPDSITTDDGTTDDGTTDDGTTDDGTTDDGTTDDGTTDDGTTDDGTTDDNENNVKNGTVVSMNHLNATVMSFNIRYENSESNVAIRQWDNRKEAVYDFILGSGADIIGFQEVKESQYNDLKTGISEKYEIIWYASYVNDSNPQGNAVAYKKDEWKVVGTPEHFFLSPTPDVPSSGWLTSHYRSCINALFEHIETGKRVNVFVTHLDHKYVTDMVNGISLILERMGESEYPVYLCGDFNCTPESEAYAIAAKALQDAQKTALDSDEGTTFTGWDDSYTDENKYVIDYCFFSKGDVVPLVYEICDGTWGENNENKLSDHRPIMATVRLIYDLEKSYPDTTENGFDCAIDPVSAE